MFPFDRDWQSVPCFRSSLLYGIGGGIGTGLLYFMFTSKTRMASHVAVSSFCGITLTYWFYCRYDYARKKFAVSQLQPILQKAAVYEGTDPEPNSNQHAKNSEV
ncbi:cytochrome c oxidase assembly protein COX20, mitochondrial [Ischnura elegans]|uniref:cytochrome c oxidase assembly protein COX20, mitochondrial n=1 Tax=Ischnura elegans TaxID=197161 RepID=UPI001ED8B09F|nr:cytochrome c oxidase assembly protein COX20, mitochondrial [Ischnura elegans]